MNKRIKNMLSVGAITIMTSSTMLPVHAMSKSSCPTNTSCGNNKVVCSTNTNCSSNKNTNCTSNKKPVIVTNTSCNKNTSCSSNKKPVIVTNTSCNKKPSCSSNKVSGKVYLYINGVKYELPLNPSCPSTPSKPEVNQNTQCNKPCNKPENTPVVKPEQKPENTPVVKPEQKPENTPVVKPEEKPENTPIVNNSDFSAYQQEVLRLVNVERAKNGLSPLTLNTKLSNVATIKSQDMINNHYFDHNSPIYGSPFDMMQQFGISYRSAGENIAMGQRSPQEVMNSWMNSSGHRANILNSKFKELGVGIAKDANGRLYWTQQFIG